VPEQDLLERLRMRLDAGHERIDRRWAQVAQPGGRRADQDDGAIEFRRVRGPVEHLPGGDVEPVPAARIMRDDAALRVGRDDELADLDLVDARARAEGRLAARSGRLHDRGAGTLRDPQGLRDQARMEPAILRGEEQRDGPDHEIRPGGEVHEAVARRGPLEVRQGRHRPGIAPAQEFPRVVSRDGEATARQGSRGRPVGRQGEAGHDVAGRGDRLGEDAIVVGNGLEPRAQFDVVLGQVPDPGGACRRRAIGFREDDVEDDRRGAGLGERGRHAREDRARPWPLDAKPRQRLVVDVDDPHGRVRLGTRLEALVEVEDAIAEIGEHVARVRLAQDEDEDEQDARHDDRYAAAKDGGEAANGHVSPPAGDWRRG